MSTPDVDDIKDYLEENSWTDEQIQGALDAESLAQQRVCVVPDDPDDMPADMAEALKRRVQRNLALRGQPALTIPGAEDGAPVILPSRDAEVRRLEAPFRKLVMG